MRLIDVDRGCRLRERKEIDLPLIQLLTSSATQRVGLREVGTVRGRLLGRPHRARHSL